MPENPLTQREADQIIEAARHITEQRDENIDNRWTSHDREHVSLQRAVDTADESARAALKAALDDHHREHTVHEAAHDREHKATEQALTKAETATEKRFEGVNEFREQLRDQAARLATKDSVDALIKDNDRRFDEMRKDHERRFDELRDSIVNIEKADVKTEGKGLGQSAVIAIFVTLVGLVATILGIIIVIANALS